MIDASIIPKTGGMFSGTLLRALLVQCSDRRSEVIVKSDYTPRIRLQAGDGGKLSDLELNRRRGVPYASTLGGGTATMAGCWL
jgi:hypothetical protein